MGEQRDNSGTLGTNKRKRPDTKDPGYSGSCQVGGVDYWLSGWVKEGPTGKFFSLAFKPKNPDQAPLPAQSRPAPQPQPQPNPDDEARLAAELAAQEAADVPF